jgi:hypothetical protein
MPRNNNPYLDAQTQNRLWTPQSISLLTWLDANDVETMFFDSPPTILKWYDKSGKGCNLRKYDSGGTSPKYYTSTKLTFDMPCVVFNGGITTDVLEFEVRPTYPINAFVVTYNGDGTNNTFNGVYQRIFGENVSGAEYIQSWEGDAWGNYFGYGDLFDYTYKNGNSSSSLSVLPMKQSVLHAVANRTDGSPSALGNRLTDYDRGWVGGFSEIILTSYIHESIKNKIIGYLAWKWKIQDSLAEYHPYKSGPPLL